MHNLTIIKQNGGFYIESREIARAVGKRHDGLLRDIGNYLDVIENTTELDFEGCDFFLESSYPDVKGRTRLCYLISKMGCEMVSSHLTDDKGILFTAAYVAKFNEAEAVEREARNSDSPRLREINAAVRNVLKGMAYCRSLPGRVMNFLRGVYGPLGIELTPDGDGCHYHSATEIARLLGVYSETNRPHGLAVAAIITKLGDTAKHSVVIPYGLVGVSVRYDRHIVEAVRDWLKSSDHPRDIEYLDFFYHIYYKPRDAIS